MPDPFDALADPAPAVDPDPIFAARLRARLDVALSLPKGVTMTTTTGLGASTDTVRHGDPGYVSLWVHDAPRAARFFAAVLGWPPDHRRVDWSAVDHGIAGDVPVTHNTGFIAFGVDDLDEALEAVARAGGVAEAPDDEPWGRTAMCTDNQHQQFALYQLPAQGRRARLAPNGERHGDVSYLTMEVIDSASARQFYREVLGWEFVPGRVEDGWGPVDVAPMMGMHGGHEVATVVPMYRVDDIGEAVARVREHGGTATDPEHQPYGATSTCTDDQGTRFYLGQH